MQEGMRTFPVAYLSSIGFAKLVMFHLLLPSVNVVWVILAREKLCALSGSLSMVGANIIVTRSRTKDDLLFSSGPVFPKRYIRQQ